MTLRDGIKFMTKPVEMMDCLACEGKGQRAIHVCATCPHKTMPCPTCGGIGKIPVPREALE